MMESVFAWMQIDLTDFRTLVTQLPVVAICLAIVWYFDKKNEKKDERFQTFVREMQDDWQKYLKEQGDEQREILKNMQNVIGKHTEVLNSSIQSKNALISLIERELLARQNRG